jgi:multidrug efflux system outer membrane protein
LIAQAQYTAGLTPFLSVLQAENTVLNSRDQLAQSDAQRLSDLASLFKALGGGYDAAAAEHASAAGASRTLNR